ncbi:MAG: hypothetical protein PHP51_03770 [Desulfotomaculaceae bacterium]|nr:hypothetical protein [Desulfotomaculaceae bacterium]MDD4766764.1 hypothetical protein [Desulfotomaculaceae bacterium]
MSMERVELLVAIENTQNKINSVKEMLTEASEQSIAAELQAKLKSLLHTHIGLIDQLG